MRKQNKMKRAILVEAILLFSLCIIWFLGYMKEEGAAKSTLPDLAEVFSEKKHIKWVEFNASYEALCEAYKWDVETYQEAADAKEADAEAVVHVNWIELLAYTAAKRGGEFGKNSISDISKAAKQLKSGETTLMELTDALEYYPYYYEAYSAILSGYVGEYEIQQTADDGSLTWVKKYGLKAFSPIAKGFDYSDFDDFGASRSYGYARPHLGHDMMGQVGTPVISIESGYVEAIGWNQYGGWRLGIRSFDGKRYYYYAHLRQNFPYALRLKEGSVVTAGEVIGYMGHTGYSTKENVNNIKVTHLHWGLQLIFDESQKDSDNEIWIDCYNLTRFLYQNKSETVKNTETKEWNRIYDMKDPAVAQYQTGKGNP